MFSYSHFFSFECLTFHSLLFIFLSSHNEAEPSMVRSGAYSIGKFCQANKYVLIFKFMSNDLQTVAAPGGGRARGAIAPLWFFFLLVSSAVGHGYDINNVGPRPTNFVCTTSAAQRCHMGCGASRLHAGSPAKSSYIQEHGYSQSSSSQSSAVVPLLRKRALVIANNLHS